ncbi:MAG: diheme cytochrome c-553, partial [Bacteroidota bacterium]|nr:diheme cytochrome c-553 [Bacteroidota bacterium]
MKSTILKAALVMSFLLMTACSRPAEPSSQAAAKPTKAELVARGKYLTTVGGCSDCHSPKVMTPHGPEPDPARMF